MGTLDLREVAAAVEVVAVTLRPPPKYLSQNARGVPCDDGACEMKHGLIVVGLLFPPDEETPKTIDPGMAPLDDPAPRSFARVRSELIGLLAPRFDVRCVGPATQEFSCIRVVVTFVTAEVLLPATGLWARPAHCKALEREFDEGLVMRVRSCDRHGQRNAVSIRKKGTLGAALASVRRVGTDFFPRPAELSSWLHPGSASPSRSPPTRRTLAAPPSRAGRRRPSSSIPGNTGAACWTIRTPPVRPSIGSPSEARRESRSGLGGDPHAADPPLV
jgi:hypothetical protein